MFNKSFILVLLIAILIISIGCGSIDKDNKYNKTDQTLIKNSIQFSPATHFGLAIDVNEKDIDYEVLSDLGIKTIRLFPGPFIWNNIEKQKNTYVFTETDSIVQFYQENGFELIATIWPYQDIDQYKCNPPFCEISNYYPELPKSRCMPCNMNSYLTFLNLLVERYDGDGNNDMPNLSMPIKTWEIMHRPEQSVEHERLFVGSPIDLVTLQIFNYDVIKKADPSSLVLHAGSSITLQQEIEFWNQAFNRKLGKYTDKINLIIFDDSISDNKENEENNIHSQFKQVQDIKKNHNLSQQLWISEFKVNGTGHEQAIAVFKGYIFGFAQGAEMIMYGDYYGDAGIIDQYNQKKESFNTIKTLIKKIDHFSEIKIIDDGIFQFTFDKKNVFVTWNDAPDELRSQKNKNKKYLVTDYLGNEKIVSGSDITVKVPIIIEPLK